MLRILGLIRTERFGEQPGCAVLTPFFDADRPHQSADGEAATVYARPGALCLVALNIVASGEVDLARSYYDMDFKLRPSTDASGRKCRIKKNRTKAIPISPNFLAAVDRCGAPCFSLRTVSL